MATIYSKLLGRGYFSSGGGHTLYTAPSTGLAVIRSITYSTYTSATNSGYIGISGEAVLAGWSNLPVLVPITVNMRQVLSPGDVLQLVLAASDAFVCVSGYYFTS